MNIFTLRPLFPNILLISLATGCAAATTLPPGPPGVVKYLNEGQLANNAKFYPQAVESYEQALVIAVHINDELWIANSELELGNALAMQTAFGQYPLDKRAISLIESGTLSLKALGYGKLPQVERGIRFLWLVCHFIKDKHACDLHTKFMSDEDLARPESSSK